jgi:hypothetical protein
VPIAVASGVWICRDERAACSNSRSAT